MKKILKDHFVWGIVALFLTFVIYTYSQESGKMSWLPSNATMPITHTVIDLIIALIIVGLSAYRFQARGGIIASLAASLVIVWCHVDALAEIDVWMEILLIGAICILISLIIGKLEDSRKKSRQVEKRIKVFSSAVAGAIDGMAITDMKGTITYANPAMEQLYGYKMGELLGKSVVDFATSQEMANEIIPTLTKTGSWSGEIESMRKNKETFPAILSLSTVRDDEATQ